MGISTSLFRSAMHAGSAAQPPKLPRVSSIASCRALIACAALAPSLSFAAPVVFEETAKIASPDPTFYFPRRVAVEDDTIIATGVKSEGEFVHYAAFLFRRQSNGAWVYVNTLAQTSCDTGEIAEDTCHASVAIRNGLAVVAADKVHIFERTPTGDWIAAPSDGFTGPGDAAVGTGAVLTSDPAGCRWDSRVFRKNSAGMWTLAHMIPGPGPGGCDPWGVRGADVDMSAGNFLITALPDSGEVHIHEPNASSWTHAATLTSPVNRRGFGQIVAIDDARAFVSGTRAAPIHVFNRNTGAWTYSADIAPPDSAQYGAPSVLKVRDLIVAGFAHDPHRGGSVGVFRESPSRQYEQVARLVASDSGLRRLYLGSDVDAYVDGSFARIVAADGVGSGALYVFDLTDLGVTPAPLQENFEQGVAANWTPAAGSSFSVTASGGSRVYRQSSVAADASSFITGIDWTNQAVEADVKPVAFNGTDRWVGLAVRRTDDNNNYYITLRQSNVLELKRIVNGAFITLASTPMPVALNRKYRLRLEASGTLLRAYVDGRLAVEAHDTALTHGHPGVRMYKTRAEFDNVILSQNPHLTLLDQRIYSSLDERWSLSPGVWNSVFTDNQRLVQQDVSGDARAVTLVEAGDQIVQVRASGASFAAGAGSRWFGVIVRYVDADNFYYITVRRDNTVSLRKLVNGAIHVLDTAPLTVSTGTSYALRLEAIGSSLRAYVNGALLLEANDASHARGTYGAAMYKTAATYDDFVAWEP